MPQLQFYRGGDPIFFLLFQSTANLRYMCYMCTVLYGIWYVAMDIIVDGMVGIRLHENRKQTDDDTMFRNEMR